MIDPAGFRHRLCDIRLRRAIIFFLSYALYQVKRSRWENIVIMHAWSRRLCLFPVLKYSGVTGNE